MKSLHAAALCFTLTVLTSAAGAATPAAPADPVVQGKVVSVQNAGGYTYLQLDTAKGKTWAAVYTAPVHVGQRVTLEHTMTMHDFASKTLKRTFPEIVFGMLRQPAGAAPAAAHTAATAAAAGPAGVTVHVAKAKGPDAYTIAELAHDRTTLAGKTVEVRGQVVHFYPQIMGRNWVHLRDGTGSAADASNELLVTTSDTTKVGDVVTARGVVGVDKNFGAGYAYRVLLEKAKLTH